MPNHITNIVMPIGDEQKIKEMLDCIKNDKFGLGTIDFDKIIPMPEELNIDAGSRMNAALKLYREFVVANTFETDEKNVDLLSIHEEKEKEFLDGRKDISPSDWELGKRAFNNMQKHTFSTWYDWRIANWGTKWNAYGYVEGEDYSKNSELRFLTAWSEPRPVILKLSKKYPEICFEHLWADEDIGINCGQRIYADGVLDYEYIPDYGKDSYEFSAKVLEVNLSDYGYRLNKTRTRYVNIEIDDYQLIEIMGLNALFTNERLTDGDIPEGLYRYDLGYGDNGNDFARLERRATVNHAGTILTKEPVDLGVNGSLLLSDDTQPNFIGDSLTVMEFINDEYQKEGERMDLC